MLTIQLDQTGQNGYIYHQIYMKIKEEILNSSTFEIKLDHSELNLKSISSTSSNEVIFVLRGEDLEILNRENW